MSPTRSFDDLLLLRNRDGRMPLHMAAMNGNTGVVRVLLAHGGYIFAQDNNKQTTVHLAAKNGHYDILDELLKSIRSDGYQTNVPNEYLFEPHQNPVDLNLRDAEGQTALHAAVKGNADANVIRLLISHGAMVNARDSVGQTALDYLEVKNGNQSVLEVLLAAGATTDRDQLLQRILDIKDSGNSWKGEPMLLLLLKKRGDGLNAATGVVQDALKLSVDNICDKAVELLVGAGFEGRYLSELLHKTLDQFHSAPNLDGDFDKKVNIGRLLIEAGADVNAKDGDETVLFKAVSKDAAGIVQRLVEEGANVNEESRGIPVLHKLMRDYGVGSRAKNKILELLLEYGADASIRYNEETILDRAVNNMRWEAARIILQSKSVDSLCSNELLQLINSKDDGIPGDISKSTSKVSKGHQR